MKIAIQRSFFAGEALDQRKEDSDGRVISETLSRAISRARSRAI